MISIKTDANSAKPYAGIFGKAQQKHLLNRLLFGATPDDMTFFAGKSLVQSLNILLTPSAIPAPPVNYYQSIGADPQGIALGETWVTAAYGDGTVNGRRKNSLRAWWIDQMMKQDRSITEQMILFWHNHFSTEFDSYNDARYGFRYQDTLRKNALGNFKDFVKEITLDPAMLRYLNGDKNSKNAPDENYGRELQELFTVGKGTNSKYTESDVKSTARVLTGYRVNGTTISSTFTASLHDSDDKQFSEFYGNTVIKGRTGNDGAKELDDLLTMIFKTQEAAKFIVRELYTYFFFYDITPEIEQDFITPMAKIFWDGNYEIKPLLRALFGSNHFFDGTLSGAIIKSPLQQLIGTNRILGVQLPEYNLQNVYEYYLLLLDFMQVAQRGEQQIGDPPSVAGWPAYYQAPVYHEIWINSSTYPERTKFTDKLVVNGYVRNKKPAAINLSKLVQQRFTNPGDPNALIDECIELLYHVPVTDEFKAKTKTDILLTGQTSDYYWTDLWNEFTKTPTTTNTALVKKRLENLFQYLLALPEYQLT